MQSAAKFISTHLAIEKWAAYYEMTKPGITFTVVASMLMGFLIGSAGSFSYLVMLHATLGTYLIAAGTAAHNQFIERKLDRLMNRTSSRPLPEKRVSPREGLVFSLFLIFGGLFYLVMMVNWIAGLVSILTTALYLLVYTPMKRVSFVNMIIGAVPGALPPVGGWAAAGATLWDPGVWILFGIIFLWQVPHVLAIAWLCNDDYRNAGFNMLPRNDRQGYKTAGFVLFFLLLLIPVIYSLFYVGMTGMIYLSGSLLATFAYLYYGVRFAWSRSKDNAKNLMFASFIYLPVVWLFILLDFIL